MQAYTCSLGGDGNSERLVEVKLYVTLFLVTVCPFPLEVLQLCKEIEATKMEKQGKYFVHCMHGVCMPRMLRMPWEAVLVPLDILRIIIHVTSGCCLLYL